MKFSICVPVYNVEKYIDLCIKSVLNQTYRDFELILVNDGSTDISGEICESYAQRDKRIKVFHKKNEGQIATRMVALSHATGDYIVFLDSDDTLDVLALQILYNVIQKYSVDCVIYNWKRICDGNIIYSNHHALNEIQYIDNKRELYKKILSDNYYNSLCIKCMKRSAYTIQDYSKYFYLRHGEDLLQSLDALAHCENAVFIPDELYNYTINPSSVTQTKNLKNYTIDFTVRERVLEFLKEQDVFTEQDMQDYRVVCVKILIAVIKEICCLDGKWKEKKKLLLNIEKSSYYKTFLFKQSFSRDVIGGSIVIYDLFKRKHYFLLIGIIGTLKKIKLFLK